MADYRRVKSLSAVDAAYIAGLIDGEGTVTLTRKHGNENRQLAVSISSTEKYLLEFVLNRVGAGKVTGKRTARLHHTPSYTYAVYTRQALVLLELVQSYIRGCKRLRARLILKEYLEVTPRNGKYTLHQQARRNAFEKAVLDIKPNNQTN